jgi:probable phosphoglycerate mutase
MKIYFARHGESHANLLHVISNRGLKHPLTQKGRAQAFALAGKFQNQSIARIYSSPVLRALEPTVIVANQLGVEYEITEALREYDLGDLEGTGDERTWAFWQELFDDWTRYGRWERSAPGGETFHDVQRRFVAFIERLIQQHAGSHTNLLCVGHGGLYWVMLPQVLTNIEMQFILDHLTFEYTSVIVAELRSEGLVCLEWNGIPITSEGKELKHE